MVCCIICLLMPKKNVQVPQQQATKRLKSFGHHPEFTVSLIHYIALTWCDVCIIPCQPFQHRFFWGPLGRSKMDPPKHKTPKICRSKPLDPRVSPHRSAGFCWRKKHFRGAHGTEVETGNVTFFNGVNGWEERSDVRVMLNWPLRG